MGIRQKIMIGFLSLGALLFFSGIISYFELSKLTTSTNQMLESSTRNIEFSRKMLDAVQEQNTALLHTEVLGLSDYDSLLMAGGDNFNRAVEETGFYVFDLPGLDTIYAARRNYNDVIVSHFSDTLSREDRIMWFVTTYKTEYYNLTSAIKNFMINSQLDMEAKTQLLEDNAYRAVMPGIIALVIGIIIILIFYYFIDIYYVAPILKITKALNSYFTLNIPFSVNIEGRDEIVKLKDYIEQMTLQLKNKKNNNA